MKFLHLLTKKKYIFILMIAFTFLVFKDFLNTLVFFDMNSPDLSKFDHTALFKMKKEIMLSNINLTVLKFNFMFYASFIIPILLVIVSYDYSKIRSNNLRFNIGKNNKYNDLLLNLKLKLAGFNTIVIFSVFFFVILIGKILGGAVPVLDEFVIDKGSILLNIFNEGYKYLFFVAFTIMIAVFINSMFLFTLLDYTNYIYGVLLYLGVMWIASLIIYPIFPKYIVPMSTIMISAYGKLTFLKVILPYSSIILILMYFVLYKKYEVK